MPASASLSCSFPVKQWEIRPIVNVLDLYRLKFHYRVELSLKVFTNEEILLSNHCCPKCLLQRPMTKHLPKKPNSQPFVTFREANFASARKFSFSRNQGTILGIWERCELLKPGREKSIIYTNSSRVMQAADYFSHIIALNSSVTMFFSFNFAGFFVPNILTADALISRTASFSLLSLSALMYNWLPRNFKVTPVLVSMVFKFWPPFPITWPTISTGKRRFSTNLKSALFDSFWVL